MSKKIEVYVTELVINDEIDHQFLRLSEASSSPKARDLTMVIGSSEAREIRRCIQNTKSRRPLTHELAYKVIHSLNADLVSCFIHDMKDGVYYAELQVEFQGSLVAFDCRPSDGIALSVRGKVPIYLADQLFQNISESA